VWWDGECDRLNDAKLVAFREFRKNGTSYNNENYLISERVLRSLCRDKKKWSAGGDTVPRSPLRQNLRTFGNMPRGFGVSASREAGGAAISR
jgi:hypothetical protein